MLYDRAQARCLRLAAGLSVGEAAEFADIAERAVWRFETQRDPLPFYIDKLTQLLTTQDTVVDELVAGASAGAIRTYFRDDDTFTATEGRLPFASTHQVCAGRAAELIPGAVVVARREGDVDAAIPARAARIGLVGKTMARAMRISQNSARRWLGAWLRCRQRYSRSSPTWRRSPRPIVATSPPQGVSQFSWSAPPKRTSRPAGLLSLRATPCSD